jgi:coniferyl-aldehyde dehydrogenase
MVNEGNYDRVKAYIDDATDKGANIVVLSPAGEDWDDRQRHKIPIHLIIDPSDDMQVMQEELFGPVLCIKPYDKIDDCIEVINDRPRPLAFYYLGKDKAEQQHVIDNTIAGGMCINDLAVALVRVAWAITMGVRASRHSAMRRRYSGKVASTCRNSPGRCLLTVKKSTN